MDIYLLDVEELMRDGMEARLEPLLEKLDSERRGRVLAAKTPQGRAAQIGAGLLLQRIAQQGSGLRQKAVQDGSVQQTACSAAFGQAPRIRRCTAGELLTELGEPVMTAYRYGKNGKPYFADMPLFFSLSHSGAYVLCAASGREVGADIQRYRSVDVRRMAGRFFAERERLALEQCADMEERQRLFFTLWSRKEAYGKLTGEGAAAVLGQDMEDVGVEWTQVLPPDRYAAAICSFV